jgi:hypothetical protein
MPQHVHPVIRSLETVEETLGLIKPLNSVGYNIIVAAENAGTRPPAPVPVGAGYFVLKQKLPHGK